MTIEELRKTVDALAALPKETEWVEFKHNFHSPEEIGERLSAISNSACLVDESFGYLVFGVMDETHEIVGTSFRCKTHKKGGEELEMWLLNRLSPRIDIELFEFDYSEGIHISMYKIPAAVGGTTKFLNQAYIRVGSLTKLLVGYPEKEAKIWRKNECRNVEDIIVKEVLDAGEAIALLSVQTFFDKLKLSLPTTREAVIEKLCNEKVIKTMVTGYGITMLGAILFAKNLRDFGNLSRKSPRVIVYSGKNKVETIREQEFEQGYAVCAEEMLKWVNGQIPSREVIGIAGRDDERMYSKRTMRELVMNALIHQDFAQRGFPMIEIYSDRVEISNAGLPLISPERFIDEYESRNEALSDLMRRMDFCEEKGSGMDKVIIDNEQYMLPPVKVRVSENRTIVTVFGYKSWSDTTREERLQACYQHACLKYVSNEKMTNQTLRTRFGIDPKNYSMASRLIKEATDAGLIKIENPDVQKRADLSYVPFWA